EWCVEGRGRECDRREEGELLPEQRQLVVADATVDARASQLVSNRLATGQLDAKKRRALPNVGWRQALRLDANRSSDDARIPSSEQRDVIDAVQQRHHARRANTCWWRERKRGLELRRLRRHPDNVDITVETRRCGNVDLEVAEDCALDGEPTLVMRERLRPHEQDDLRPGARECGGEQTADSAGAEDRMAHLPFLTFLHRRHRQECRNGRRGTPRTSG